MPSEIRILSLTASESGVTLAIEVNSKSAVADTIMQLRQFETIEIGTISGISENRDETGVSTVNFSADCRYVDTQMEEEAEAESDSIAETAAEVGAETDAETADLENESME